MVGTQQVTCIVSAEETGGAYSLFEVVIPPRDPGPPPHTHSVEDELFYVLEGEHVLVIDGQEMRGGPGAWMMAPRHRPHAFRNDGDTPSRVLVVASPGGFEKFFEACGEPMSEEEIAPTPPTQTHLQKILDTMPQFGMTVHLPPPPGSA